MEDFGEPLRNFTNVLLAILTSEVGCKLKFLHRLKVESVIVGDC